MGDEEHGQSEVALQAAEQFPHLGFAELAAWVKANPGRFTYPAPHTDFTGSAFLRMALYETTGGYEQYLGEYDGSKFRPRTQSGGSQPRSGGGRP